MELEFRTSQLTDLFVPGERMEIHLNITFPQLPCEILTLDVMDISGELQSGVIHGINKVRLSPEAEGSKVLAMRGVDL
jgi:hypothetical protein